MTPSFWSLVWKYQCNLNYSILSNEVVFADHSVYLDIGNGEIAKLSARDGSVVDTYSVDPGIFTNLSLLVASPDGKKLAFVTNTSEYGMIKITLAPKISASKTMIILSWHQITI